MKSGAFMHSVAFAVFAIPFLPAVANAGPQNRHLKDALVQNQEEQYVLLTGSNIPQKVKVTSIGTDSVHNIRIYTQRELLSTGRQTVAGSLALDPSIQISGR